MHYKGNVLGGALLVAGTTIGGGMLALPVLTSLTGFYPSIVIYLICWLFMASTGLLFLEISQWMKGEANIISMAEGTLGKGGRYFAWLIYLFLFYCLTVAYMVGCGNILVVLTGNFIPDWLGPIVFVILFAPLILMPTVWAGHLNIWLVAGLALSYFGFVVLGFSYVKPELLKHDDWTHSLKVLPIVFAAFSYQGIIPTLASYMHHDAQKIRRAILIGSFIPLVAYIVWQWLILGIVPLEGEHGLSATLKNGQNAVQPLGYFLESKVVYWLGQSLAFFALITSFLGVTLGLRDFFADGLDMKKNIPGMLLLAILVLVPPLMIAVSYPHIFLIALDYAGGFGCALLLGLLPIIMVWRGRYSLHWPLSPQLPGGRFVLASLAVFVSVELLSEFKSLFFRIFA